MHEMSIAEALLRQALQTTEAVFSTKGTVELERMED